LGNHQYMFLGKEPIRNYINQINWTNRNGNYINQINQTEMESVIFTFPIGQLEQSAPLGPLHW